MVRLMLLAVAIPLLFVLAFAAPCLAFGYACAALARYLTTRH